MISFDKTNEHEAPVSGLGVSQQVPKKNSKSQLKCNACPHVYRKSKQPAVSNLVGYEFYDSDDESTRLLVVKQANGKIYTIGGPNCEWDYEYVKGKVNSIVSDGNSDSPSGSALEARFCCSRGRR